MPLYEYQCTSCHQTCEKLEKMSAEPAKTCPHCQSDSLKRLISATRFQLKGTGWYETDFKHKGKPPAKSTEKKAEKPEENTKKNKDSSTKENATNTNTNNMDKNTKKD